MLDRRPREGFDSDQAIKVGEALVAKVIELTEPYEAHLGLATTRQLLDELRTRIEVDYFVGGGGLDYTTMSGRPASITSWTSPTRERR